MQYTRNMNIPLNIGQCVAYEALARTTQLP